jgi:quinolinate synthase
MGNFHPEDYRALPTQEILAGIRRRKSEMGRSLLILGHHYQRQEIIDVSDRIGDSLQLAEEASKAAAAKYIVFCGVRFMAETADILRRTSQKVIHPDPRAGCPMADMASLSDVEQAWEELGGVLNLSTLVPVTYVNSGADLKAFCGRRGGIVCTSSNAFRALEWAFDRGKTAFFFPDQHLGRNTGREMGISHDAMALWDPREELGGNDPETIQDARLILWNGYCHVHTFFTVSMVKRMRERHPGCLVVVHPECEEKVVLAADAVGSTSFIVQYVDEAPPKSTIVIGTESNLVARLKRTYDNKTILALAQSLCPNMWKIDPARLCWCLENLDEAPVVSVPEGIKKDARAALERMLSLT